MSETFSELLDRICPGVTPSEGEPLVFFVQSKSRAGVKHRYDMTACPPNGQCTCEKMKDFGVNTRLENGMRHGANTICEHGRRVRLYIALVIVENCNRALENGERDAVETLLRAPCDTVEEAF